MKLNIILTSVRPSTDQWWLGDKSTNKQTNKQTTTTTIITTTKTPARNYTIIIVLIKIDLTNISKLRFILYYQDATAKQQRNLRTTSLSRPDCREREERGKRNARKQQQPALATPSCGHHQSVNTTLPVDRALPEPRHVNVTSSRHLRTTSREVTPTGLSPFD